MFDEPRKTIIMTPEQERMKALRWLLKATAKEGMQNCDLLRNLSVSGSELICADGFRLHILSAEDFCLGDDVENLEDGVWRVVFGDDEKTVAFIPVEIKYPNHNVIIQKTEDGVSGFAELGTAYLIDALAAMGSSVRMFVHEPPNGTMITGKVCGIHAVAVIMPMSTYTK